MRLRDRATCTAYGLFWIWFSWYVATMIVAMAGITVAAFLIGGYKRLINCGMQILMKRATALKATFDAKLTAAQSTNRAREIDAAQNSYSSARRSIIARAELLDAIQPETLSSLLMEGIHALQAYNEVTRRRSQIFSQLVRSRNTNPNFICDVILFFVMRFPDFENALGDIQEEYELRKATDVKSASIWYRTQTVKEVCRFALRWGRAVNLAISTGRKLWHWFT